MENQKETKREFKLTTLALKNKNTVYLLLFILVTFGIYIYRQLPKELFPDIYMPYVFVQTIYPGNSPVDIENLITRPIEKELEIIKDVKEISSNSLQDISLIFIEFNTDVPIEDALQEVRDAVDKAKAELPNDLLDDPMITDLDFSEFPIININLSGDYSVSELKNYAEYLEEEIESISEISKVNITGLNEREVKIDVDIHQLENFKLNFGDIENAIISENITMSGGEIIMGNTKRSVRVIGEFNSIESIKNIVVKHENQNVVYLKDVADVAFDFADPTSYARLNEQPVVTVQVIKKGGENLLNATDQIFDIIDHAQETKALPASLNVTITNDQSDMVRKQLSNLENSILLGVIFVLLVLFFFLGIRNALFVGLAIPTSMFLSFMVLGIMDSKINMIILFSLIMALGMLVDNAIVVVENIYRFIDKGYSKFEAAKQAVGEIAIPIITSTATTLAAFFPLLFWKSIMGEFMKYLPQTLIIVLTSSLLVALVFIPVISSTFIKQGDQNPKPKVKRAVTIAVIFLILSALSFLSGSNILGNLFLLFALLGFANVFFLYRLSKWFQEKFLVWLENIYLKFIRFALKGRNPFFLLIGAFLLLAITIAFYFNSNPKVVFFPESDPEYINILAELPDGTDIEATHQFMLELEQKTIQKLNPYNDIVKSVQLITGDGAVLENEGMSGNSGGAERGLITVSFIDYEFRQGINTIEILKELSNEFVGKYPGITITVDKQRDGPPTGKPINLEISGKDFETLIALTDSIYYFIEAQDIPGIEALKTDLDIGAPEIIVTIDRDKARRYGLSTYSIANTLRTAIYGKEISDYKLGEDEFPIQLRLKEEYRNSLSSLLNQKVTFRSATTGQIMQVPISAVADAYYSSSYGSVLRKDLNRVITIYSNVLKGYNATEINNQLKELLADYEMPEGYSYQFTGEQEEQAESMAFLMMALLIAVSVIIVIIVTQFNSWVKPAMIIFTVLLSTIGVFGGLGTFKMDFVVTMTGIGIVALAGVVVNNAIVLIDYIGLLKKRKKEALGLNEDDLLPDDLAKEAIVEGGKTRLRPVLLTAITTILGLIPLASGVNIDIVSFLQDFDPHIYWGGSNVKFWGPISWTIIFGLSFATFLTLIVLPAMYHMFYSVKARWIRRKLRKQEILNQG